MLYSEPVICADLSLSRRQRQLSTLTVRTCLQERAALERATLASTLPWQLQQRPLQLPHLRRSDQTECASANLTLCGHRQCACSRNDRKLDELTGAKWRHAGCNQRQSRGVHCRGENACSCILPDNSCLQVQVPTAHDVISCRSRRRRKRKAWGWRTSSGAQRQLRACTGCRLLMSKPRQSLRSGELRRLVLSHVIDCILPRIAPNE